MHEVRRNVKRVPSLLQPGHRWFDCSPHVIPARKKSQGSSADITACLPIDTRRVKRNAAWERDNSKDDTERCSRKGARKAPMHIFSVNTWEVRECTATMEADSCFFDAPGKQGQHLTGPAHLPTPFCCRPRCPPYRLNLVSPK